MLVNTRHRRTLAAIVQRPTLASIAFSDIEVLIKALGGSVSEREGSRVRIELGGEVWRCRHTRAKKRSVTRSKKHEGCPTVQESRHEHDDT